MAKKSRHDINVAEAARKNGLPPHVVHNRLNRGWSLDDALGKPVRLKKSPKKKAAVKKKAKVANVSPVREPEMEPNNFERHYTWMLVAMITALVGLAVTIVTG
jgi:hypothetical protein